VVDVAIKAYVLFKVSSGAERELCRKISNLDEVLEASVIYGEYDLIAKVKVGDLPELETFLTEKMRTLPSVILTSTMIVAREYKGKSERNRMNTVNTKEKI